MSLINKTSNAGSNYFSTAKEKHFEHIVSDEAALTCLKTSKLDVSFNHCNCERLLDTVYET